MKRGTPDHPKVKELVRLLRIPQYAACGLLELLWHFTAKYAPQGDIGRWTDRQIAEAIDWRGSPERLIQVLVTVGWVDRHPSCRLIIHDWHEHADQAVQRRLKRAEQEFCQPARPLITADAEVLPADIEVLCPEALLLSPDSNREKPNWGLIQGLSELRLDITSQPEPVARASNPEPVIQEGGLIALKRRSARPQLCDEEYLDALQAKSCYQGLNVRQLYGKMVTWCETKGKQPTRSRLVNWLNREEQPMNARSNGHKETSRGSAKPQAGKYSDIDD